MKILFISHLANRTGAPLSLLNFQKWIKNNTEIEFTTLFREGGILEKEFAGLGPIENFCIKQPDVKNRFLRRILFMGISVFEKFIYRKILFLKLRSQEFDIVYSNTIVNLDVLRFLESLQIPVVTHVRELEASIKSYGGEEYMKKLNRLTTRFVAVSNAVKVNLIENHDIDNEKISVIHNSLHKKTIVYEETERNKILNQLNIPKGSFIVGGSGQTLYSKGYDLFIQLAIQLRKKYDDIYFLWIGRVHPRIGTYIDHDLEHTGLRNYVKFVGNVSNPDDYISFFNIYAMVSREESFGNVGIEAAQFKIPTICFSKVTGFSEFTDGKAGVSVPYMDVVAMVEEVIKMRKDESHYSELGENAFHKLQYYSMEEKGVELLKLINKAVEGNYK